MARVSRWWVRKLEGAASEEMVSIPQRDGTVARFPQSALAEAYVNLMDRLGAADEAPPEHPLLEAARNSSDPYWSEGMYAEDPEVWTKPVPDLSEP